MKKTLCAIALFLCASFANAADTSGYKDLQLMQNFSTLLINENYNAAKTKVSSSSQALFDRFAAHKLGSLAPDSFTIFSQFQKNGARFLKLKTYNINGKVTGMTSVAFVTESGKAKIDLPASLQFAFGEKWEKQIDFIEKSYVLAKRQFGDEASLELLKTLLKK